MRNVLRAALLTALLAPASALGAGPAPAPQGAAWLLVDGQTGDVLAKRAADQPRAMASLTKMMTALVALESGDPDRLVQVVPAAAAVGESSAGLRPGERISVRDLVRALMIGSGNDAGTALAYAVAGSEGEFVVRMNDKAKALGMSRTRFANPHGLDAPGQESSPQDLLVLGREVMKDPFLRRLVAGRAVTIPGPGGQGPAARGALRLARLLEHGVPLARDGARELVDLPGSVVPSVYTRAATPPRAGVDPSTTASRSRMSQSPSGTSTRRATAAIF